MSAPGRGPPRREEPEKMDSYDLLMTLAEIGVTIASLSAVAGVIESARGESQAHPMTIRLFRDVALLGMLAALFAVVPMVVEPTPSRGGEPWRWCSSVGAAVWAILYAAFVREVLPAVRKDRLWVPFLFGLSITLLGLGSLVYNAILPSTSASQLYTIAVVCLLALAGFDFLIAAFRLSNLLPARQESAK